MTHLLQIVFCFRWRSFIFRFNHSFLILPKITHLHKAPSTCYNMFRTMISVFMCKRRGKSKNRSMNSNFTTICNSFNIFSGVDDQIRSKQWNTKHARHWSCLLLNSTRLTFKPGQADPQDSINEFIIRKWNPLVVVDFRFISAFLHE